MSSASFISLVLFVLCIVPVAGSGGVNVFTMHTDLFWLGACMTALVILTIVFEQGFHAYKHHLTHRGLVYAEVFDKIQGELTVLGFISIVTIIVAQFLATNPIVAEILPEFEVSHIWLFVIGMLFVCEAFLMMSYANDSVVQLTDHDRVDPEEVLKHLKQRKRHCISRFKSRAKRFCYCRCPGGCLKTRHHDAAVHKLYRVFFKHFYRVEIERNLHKRSAKFDFASYLVAFWKHEVVSLQEIASTSWIFFLILFWTLIGLRAIYQDIWADTAYTSTAIAMNYFCLLMWLLLIIEGFWSRIALNEYIVQVITGSKNGQSGLVPVMKGEQKKTENDRPQVTDALEHLKMISVNNKTWDRDGADWNMDQQIDPEIDEHVSDSIKNHLQRSAMLAKIVGGRQQRSDSDEAEQEENVNVYADADDHDDDDDDISAVSVEAVREFGHEHHNKEDRQLIASLHQTSSRISMQEEEEKEYATRHTVGSIKMKKMVEVQKQEKKKKNHSQNIKKEGGRSSPNKEEKAATFAAMDTGIEMMKRMSMEAKHKEKLVMSLAHQNVSITMDGGVVLNAAEKYQLRSATTKRLNSVKPIHMRGITCCSNRVRQVIFSALLFLHSFLYGWFLMVNVREVFNWTKYYGRVPSAKYFAQYIDASNVTSSASSSAHISSTSSVSSSSSSASAAVTDSHRRMLLWNNYGRKTSSAATSSSASATSSSAASSGGSAAGSSHGPNTLTPGWYTCEEFYAACEHCLVDENSNLGFAFSFTKVIRLINGDTYGFHADQEITCSIHNLPTSPIFVFTMTFLPLLFTTFLLIPTYLRLYAYQKAIMGNRSKRSTLMRCCGYRGVRRTKVLFIKNENGEVIKVGKMYRADLQGVHIGDYDTEQAAAEAHDNAVREKHGKWIQVEVTTTTARGHHGKKKDRVRLVLDKHVRMINFPEKEERDALWCACWCCVAKQHKHKTNLRNLSTNVKRVSLSSAHPSPSNSGSGYSKSSPPLQSTKNGGSPMSGPASDPHHHHGAHNDSSSSNHGAVEYEHAQGGHGVHDGNAHDGHDGHDGHGHGSCLTNCLFGETHTSFDQLIRDVSDVIQHEHRITIMTRHNVLRALRRNFAGIKDLRQHLDAEKRATVLGTILQRKGSKKHLYRGVSVAFAPTPRHNAQNDMMEGLPALPPNVSVDHHAYWSTHRGLITAKKYAQELFDWILVEHSKFNATLSSMLENPLYAPYIAKLRGSLGEKKSIIASENQVSSMEVGNDMSEQEINLKVQEIVKQEMIHNKVVSLQGLDSLTFHDCLKLAKAEVDATELRWGIRILYKKRLHVGTMTEQDGFTLMRALDMDGDGKMSFSEWMEFLFPSEVDVEDVDEEEENLKRMKELIRVQNDSIRKLKAQLKAHGIEELEAEDSKQSHRLSSLVRDTVQFSSALEHKLVVGQHVETKTLGGTPKVMKRPMIPKGKRRLPKK